MIESQFYTLYKMNASQQLKMKGVLPPCLLQKVLHVSVYHVSSRERYYHYQRILLSGNLKKVKFHAKTCHTLLKLQFFVDWAIQKFRKLFYLLTFTSHVSIFFFKNKIVCMTSKLYHARTIFLFFQKRLANLVNT